MAETAVLTVEPRPQPPRSGARLLVVAALAASGVLHAGLLGVLNTLPVVPKEAERTAPITVDLVAAPEAPEPPKPEPPKPEPPKPEPPKPEPQKLDLPEFKPQREPQPQAQQPPAPQKQQPKPRPAPQQPQQQPQQPQQQQAPQPQQPPAATASPPPSAETPAEAAQRLAELIHAEDLLPQTGGTPAEQAARIAPLDLQKFVAHLASCWKPQAVPDAPNLKAVLRLNLQPNGRLRGEPELIAATFSVHGPALVANAKQAVAKCQPFSMLPADRYSEWRMLDLTFTPRGLHIGGVQQ